MGTLQKILFVLVMVLIAASSGRSSGDAQGSVRVSRDAAPATDTAKPVRGFREPPIFVLSVPRVGSEDARSPEEELALSLIGGDEEADAVPERPRDDRCPRQSYVSEGALSSDDAAGYAVFYPVRVVEAPRVAAEIAMVADLLTGETYFEKNSGRRWPIASITKLVAAAHATRTMPFDEKVTITEGDVSAEDTTAVRSIHAGETYAVRDLVSAMLVVSSNEAAEAIARVKGREAFLAGMNELVRSWGMYETYIADPAGLSPATQSTAEDLRIMAAKIYEEYADLYRITSSKKLAIAESGTRRRQMLANINAFAGDRGFVGGKTGYIDEAGSNLLSVFLHEKRPIFVLVLGAEDRFAASADLINWFRSSFTLRP